MASLQFYFSRPPYSTTGSINNNTCIIMGNVLLLLHHVSLKESRPVPHQLLTSRNSLYSFCRPFSLSRNNLRTNLNRFLSRVFIKGYEEPSRVSDILNGIIRDGSCIRFKGHTFRCVCGNFFSISVWLCKFVECGKNAEQPLFIHCQYNQAKQMCVKSNTDANVRLGRQGSFFFFFFIIFFFGMRAQIQI